MIFLWRLSDNEGINKNTFIFIVIPYVVPARIDDFNVCVGIKKEPAGSFKIVIWETESTNDLFPFNRSRRLTRNIVNDTADAVDFIDNAVRHFT